MPVPATRFAEVVARDAHPLVVGRRGQHALQQLAVAGLRLRLAAQGSARLGEARRQRVANPLQLGEPGDARLVERGPNASLDPDPGECLRAQVGELPLEMADLTAQLSPCEALVASHSQHAERFSIEQIRHRPVAECRSQQRG